MSQRDLLEQAARSLRERTAPDPGGGEETLARVVSTIRRRGARRRLVTIVGLQVAIASVGLGAWAAASGRLEVLLATLRPAPPAPRAPVRRRAAVAPPSPRPGPLSLPATPAPAPPRVSAAPPRAPARPAAAPAPDEDAVYREAHQAHFVRRDFAAALAGWNRYLALERPGRFALEARYNRAIALFRLGRREEAARAFRPFADGDYGPYRQQGARALLQRLGQPPP
jgi:hypothetical protein